MSRRKEYKEIAAMKTKVRAENRRPPFINLRLNRSGGAREKKGGVAYALPRNSTPVPMNDFKS
jgi:hypothetical protein